MRYNVLSLFLLAVVFVSYGQIPDPLRNRIEVIDEVSHVSDSILYMETLLMKLPKGPIISRFVDKDGNLYVNTKKLGHLTEAVLNPSMRNDSIFVNFEDEEYKRFISITVFLLRNHIDSSMKDNVTGFYIHGYRETVENRYVDIRDVLVNVDTTAPKFFKNYQILDRKENMVLVAPIDVDID